MFNNIDKAAKACILELANDDSDKNEVNSIFEGYIDRSSKKLEVMIRDAENDHLISEDVKEAALDALINYDMEYFEGCITTENETVMQITEALSDVCSAYNLFNETGIAAVYDKYYDK